MNEFISTKEFESEIRSAVQAPPVRAEFVQRLETQLLDISKNKATINKNILKLRPAWIAIALIFLLFSVDFNHRAAAGIGRCPKPGGLFAGDRSCEKRFFTAVIG